MEHLAKEFIGQGKPVIPLDICLGASTEDGSGGAHRLFREMRNRPQAFVKTTRPEAVGAFLTRMETDGGRKPASQVIQAILDLIRELLPPDTFYVRLLNPSVDDFNSVERYFRQVIDPVVIGFGYNPVEMGKADTSSPWMNVQIFETIHYSGVTIVDLTGARPNCLMELGYAYGQLAAVQEDAASRVVAAHYSVERLKLHLRGAQPKTSGMIHGRNAFLLLTALMELGTDVHLVATGAHAGTAYGDCGSSFMDSIQRVFDVYTDGAVRVAAPFIDWTKHDIWRFRW